MNLNLSFYVYKSTTVEWDHGHSETWCRCVSMFQCCGI